MAAMQRQQHLQPLAAPPRRRPPVQQDITQGAATEGGGASHQADADGVQPLARSLQQAGEGEGQRPHHSMIVSSRAGRARWTSGNSRSPAPGAQAEACCASAEARRGDVLAEHNSSIPSARAFSQMPSPMFSVTSALLPVAQAQHLSGHDRKQVEHDVLLEEMERFWPAARSGWMRISRCASFQPSAVRRMRSNGHPRRSTPRTRSGSGRSGSGLVTSTSSSVAALVDFIARNFRAVLTTSRRTRDRNPRPSNAGQDLLYDALAHRPLAFVEPARFLVAPGQLTRGRALPNFTLYFHRQNSAGRRPACPAIPWKRRSSSRFASS